MEREIELHCSSTCFLCNYRGAAALSGAMVVAGRLLWIIDKIKMGHQVAVTSSFNANGERQKLKVLIQPIAGAVVGSEINQCFAMAAVMSLSHIASNEILASGVCITD